MLRQFVSAGFSPDSFWQLTPREYATIMAGARERFDMEHRARAWLAWHIAALPRTKRFPDLEDLMPTQAQSPREIRMAIAMWKAATKRIQ